LKTKDIQARIDNVTSLLIRAVVDAEAIHLFRPEKPTRSWRSNND